PMRIAKPRRRIHRPDRPALHPQLEVMEDRLLLSNYDVTSVLDTGATGTLRDAINKVNDPSSGFTGIDFQIPGPKFEIDLTSDLPRIQRPVTIDGQNQAPNPNALIILNGAMASTDGLVIAGGHSTVKNLVIEGFTNGAGILLASSDNTVFNNDIG